jgi:SAM-dependent methyltransferase
VSYPRGEEYQRRFDALASAGHDVHGEATLVRSYRPRSALDAGCGTGRVAIELATHGIEVLGVDVDPAMLATATQRAPDLQWRLGDLATVDLEPERFDVAVLAGNVLIFVQPGTEADVLANVTRAVRVGGRVIAGFQLRDGGYDLDGLARDALAAGLVLEDRWSTWDRAPAAVVDDYAVSVFVRAPRPS